MTIEEANVKLSAIVDNNQSIFVEIRENHYGKPLVVTMDGNFDPTEIKEIADIIAAIDL